MFSWNLHSLTCDAWLNAFIRVEFNYGNLLKWNSVTPPPPPPNGDPNGWCPSDALGCRRQLLGWDDPVSQNALHMGRWMNRYYWNSLQLQEEIGRDQINGIDRPRLNGEDGTERKEWRPVPPISLWAFSNIIIKIPDGWAPSLHLHLFPKITFQWSAMVHRPFPLLRIR